MTGRFYDQLAVDAVLVHEPSRTVTETDNVLFTTLTMNTQPLHLDHEFAARSMHGRPLVNGLFTLSLMMGLTVSDTTLGTTAGNLGFGRIDYLAPVFVGDTLTAESVVKGKRLSKSRPGMGIVEFEHRCRNQSGAIVLTCSRQALMLVAEEPAP